MAFRRLLFVASLPLLVLAGPSANFTASCLLAGASVTTTGTSNWFFVNRRSCFITVGTTTVATGQAACTTGFPAQGLTKGRLAIIARTGIYAQLMAKPAPVEARNYCMNIFCSRRRAAGCSSASVRWRRPVPRGRRAGRGSTRRQTSRGRSSHKTCA